LEGEGDISRVIDIADGTSFESEGAVGDGVESGKGEQQANGKR
jgi:hypothetical protein